MDGNLKLGSYGYTGSNAVNLQRDLQVFQKGGILRADRWHIKRNLFVIFVSVLMVVSGTINTLSTK